MYVVGIDGGGTKTSIALFDITGKYYGTQIESYPSCLDSKSFEKTNPQLEKSIIKLIPPHSEEEIVLSSIFLGLGGIASTKDALFVESLVKTWKICKESTQIHAKNDIYCAHAAGLRGKTGMCFIIGTGSVGFGVDETGNEHRVGGYSPMEGDPGSSYHLGRMLLKALAKALDLRRSYSPLLTAVQQHLHIHGYTDYVNMINTISREETAQLAQLVTQYADVGDKFAVKLIERATDEITLMFHTIYQTLEIHNKQIAIVGSLGNAKSKYKEILYQKVKAIDANYEIFPTQLDPAIGSAILAFKHLQNENYQNFLPHAERK
ncbi:MAG: hypothetical protein E4G98_01570 [Promethearchaeota archaeon]|nr:MAG: hypothetical protein E4G98_01570 [Candidatus Lokiarchaeota archaeon]